MRKQTEQRHTHSEDKDTTTLLQKHYLNFSEPKRTTQHRQSPTTNQQSELKTSRKRAKDPGKSNTTMHTYF